MGLNSFVIMSVHLSNVYAKRPVAGPLALELAPDAAMAACKHARRPSLDIVCGDINMARWQKGSTQLWKDATYDIFEKRCILPVVDWSDECCGVASREAFVQQHLVKGSSWGEQLDEQTLRRKRTFGRSSSRSAAQGSPARTCTGPCSSP